MRAHRYTPSGSMTAGIRGAVRALGLCALVQWAALALCCAAYAAEPTVPETPAAASPSVKVAVFVSSDGNRCFAPGLVAAIRYYTGQLAKRINDSGGIGGRKLSLQVFDDFEDASASIDNVKGALDDPATIAMIGIPSSTRGEAIFTALGPEIRSRGIPFITEISLDSLFRDAPNVFTMASSVGNELDVVRKVLADAQAQHPVFIGLDDDLYVRALGEGLEKDAGSVPLAASLRAPVHDYKLDEADAEALVQRLKSENADMILLAIHSGPSITLVDKLIDAGISAPIFVLLGRIPSIVNGLGTKSYAGPMRQIAREGVPNVYSERLRQRIWRAPQDEWVFDDTRNDDAPGWTDGTCDDRGEPTARQIFDAANRRAIGRGMQYRDMLQLVVEAARSAPKDADVPALRRASNETLHGFVEGQRILKGLWQDWTFTPNRTAAGDTLILYKAPGDATIALAPMQYRRINGTLERSPTVYTSIDLISLSRIDTNDRSFDAEFYLSMKSADDSIGIDSIEFTNAYRAQSGDGRLVLSRQIHNAGATPNVPSGIKLYKVSGKFEFEPELGDYPFDTQRLSVSFQPADASKPFLIQPAPPADEQAEAPVDGWELAEHYVGSDQDIVPTLGASLAERRIVPFYKFNATWIVKRIAVDYYLRVVVPLAFILLITYFSVFLPHSRFESIMAIQVTALLSSIALYLALPKVDSDQATLSDKIFMMTYAAVSLMIGLSILKDNLRKVREVVWAVCFIQWIIFPATTVAFVMYLLPSTKGGTMQAADTLASVWRGIFG